MNPPDHGELEPRVDAELERQLEALPELRADPRFERELRARFLAGQHSAPAARAPRTAPAWLGPLAAALAAGLLLTLFWIQRQPAQPDAGPWRVLTSEPGAPVFVDGRSVIGREDQLAAALTGARRLRTTSGSLSLALGDCFALVLGPDSELVLPELSGPSDHGPYLLGAESGSLAVRTGPAFAGSRLRVRSPDSEVEVVGTRFAVDVYPEGTCVCCSEGQVAVRSLRAEDRSALVPPEGMAFAYREGEFVTGAVMQAHLGPLQGLERVW